MPIRQLCNDKPSTSSSSQGCRPWQQPSTSTTTITHHHHRHQPTTTTTTNTNVTARMGPRRQHPQTGSKGQAGIETSRELETRVVASSKVFFSFFFYFSKYILSTYRFSSTTTISRLNGAQEHKKGAALTKTGSNDAFCVVWARFCCQPLPSFFLSRSP